MPFFSSSKSTFGISGRSKKLFNLATGGSVTDVANYNGTGQLWRVHRVLSNTTFIISAASQPFNLLVQGGGGGGGGGGGNQHGGGGDGGYGYEYSSVNLAAGSHSIVIGGGGGGWGGAGGATTAFGYTANGGPGGAYMGGADTHGSTRGPNSSITGSAFQYGRFGGGVHYNWGPSTGPDNTGQGGGGGSNTQSFAPGSGGSGIVIVAYQIG